MTFWKSPPPYSLLAVLALAACGKPPAAGPANQSNVPEEEIVARLPGRVITVAELQEQINRESTFIRNRYAAPEKMKEYLENVLRVEVLAAEAQKRGYGNDPDIIRMMKQQMVARLIQKDFEPQHDPAQIPEAELRTYYEAHKTEFNEPEQADAAHILLHDEAKAKEAMVQAARLKKNDDNGWKYLVTTYSQDLPSKMRGGELGHFARNATRVPPEVINAVWAMSEAGAIAGPVKSAQGFHILRFIDKRPAIDRTFEQAEPRVRSLIFKEKRSKALESWVSSLRETAQVKVFENNLDKIKVDPSAPEKSEPSMMKYVPQIVPGMRGTDQ